MREVYEDECLDYSDFSNHCLIGVKFIRCLLRFCTFENSDLSYTVFENCDLYQSKFGFAVVYTTRLINCDLTKANFVDSYLNGIRIQGAVVTYTEFGHEFRTALERKQCKPTQITSNYYVCAIGPMQASIGAIESRFEGIYCPTTPSAITFIDPSVEEWKVWRRRSESAKVIKNILEENGYKDKSLEYYFFHRQFLRRSMNSKIKRALDYFWGELFWGYGTTIINPVIGFFANSIFFSMIYTIMPFFSPTSGLKIDSQILYIFNKDFGSSLSVYFEILYSSVLISSLSVFGNIDVSGWAKFFAVVHIIISLMSLGLGMASLTKKMANV